MTITYHARQRMQQRDITVADLQKAICIGRRYRRGTYLHFRVGEKQVANLVGQERDRLAGMAVVCGDGLTVVTTYRNRPQ